MSYTNYFADALTAEAERDSRIVAVHAAMAGGTGLDRVEKRFPDRTFDVGIAEQHAVTFAAGLACEGIAPFCTIYSTFMQRGYDQIVHDVCLQKLPGGWGGPVRACTAAVWGGGVAERGAGGSQRVVAAGLYKQACTSPTHCMACPRCPTACLERGVANACRALVSPSVLHMRLPATPTSKAYVTTASP